MSVNNSQRDLRSYLEIRLRGELADWTWYHGVMDTVRSPDQVQPQHQKATEQYEQNASEQQTEEIKFRIIQ